MAGVRLSLLVAAYGTPALVLDEDDVRYRCRDCVAALPGTEIAYAGEAFLCRAMAQWVATEGLSLAVSSAGELALAQTVNFPAERIILHGNAKTPTDLRAALRYGVDRIVVESTAEIIRLATLTPRLQRVLVQVTPGADAHADPAAPAGADEQESGFSLRSGAAGDAVRRVLSHPELTLTGLRCHLAVQPVGPTAFDPSSLDVTVRELLGLTAAVREHTGVTLTELNLGGGPVRPHVTGENEVGLVNFAERMQRLVANECAQLRIPVPRLVIEPGRAIVNRAMITLYRVLAVRHSAAGRAFVTVDGAMSGYRYPEPYGVGHLVHAVRPSTAPSEPATVVGRHSEESYLLGSESTLPADLRPGDVIAVPSTGAYNHSMASDHDLAGRPPVIAVSNGESRTLIRKETPSDLLIRDIGLLKESSVHHTLYVPVRINDAGFLTLRTGRLESGERIGMAFTSKEALSFTLGSAQQWVNLGDQSLRGMLAPVGIQHLRIDPLPLGQPGAAGIPHQARKRPGSHTYSPVTTAHTTAWAVAFRSLSQHYWQRPAPWMVRGHHKTKIAKGAAAARRPARPAGENGSVLMSGVR